MYLVIPSKCFPIKAPNYDVSLIVNVINNKVHIRIFSSFISCVFLIYALAHTFSWV